MTQLPSSHVLRVALVCLCLACLLHNLHSFRLAHHQPASFSQRALYSMVDDRKISSEQSFYNNSPRENNGEVVIEAPGINSRKITASTIIDCTIDDAWAILTDYDNLATHVPNLVQSYLLPSSSSSSSNSNNNNSKRLFQEGAQKIIGFDFRASLTMDMTEDTSSRERKLWFKLVDSAMFASFDGYWSVKYHSRYKIFDPRANAFVLRYKSKLTYSVFVRPKGPVPVIALEWRIKEDIPINLAAVKRASEMLNNGRKIDDLAILEFPILNSQFNGNNEGWGADETLGSYIPLA